MPPLNPTADPSLTPRPDHKGRLITPCRPKWRGTMTDRQRFCEQMHHRPVDRCFNMEFGYWADNFKVWPIFRDHGLKYNLQADIFFNFDRIATVGGKVWMHPAFERKVISETDTHQVIVDGSGVLAEVPRDGHDTIAHFIKSSVNSPEDWKRIKAERFCVDHPDRVVDIDAILQRHPPGRDYPLGVDCGSMIGVVRDMLTFEGLAYACHDYPEMVDDMVETACRLVEHFLDQVLGKIEFDFASGWEDICFKNGPIVSVDFFRSVVVPRYKRISQRLRAAGIDLWYADCDGDIRLLVEQFLAGGMNCLFPFEVNSAGHPGELLRQYGPELRIMGGVDKLQLKAGPAATRAYLEALVPLVERGGYIPFCDHRCPPDVSQENYLYYLDLKEQVFGMKV